MPNWNETIPLGDVFHDDDLPFEQRRDRIVERVKASHWYRNAERDGLLLVELVDELTDTQTPAEFDGPWSLIYDAADISRVWIETHQ